jgi:hypothetical protein
MGHGYSAVTATGINKEFLDKNFPETMQEIENHPDFEYWGALVPIVTDGDGSQELLALFKRLASEFEEFTRTGERGLQLYLHRYESESAERYDNVKHTDDCIFCVDGVYVKTPAANRFNEELIEMSWAAFG